MERINVNGVWYVREDSLQQEEEKNIEIYSYVGYNCETSDYSWEATKHLKDDGETFYDEIGIAFTDKRKKIEDYWDSNAFFKGVLENDPESIADLRETVDKNGEIDFKTFLSVLKDKGWL